MPDATKCPKCGMGLRETRAIGGNLRITETWFSCGALESKENGKVVVFTQSDQCRINELTERVRLLERLFVLVPIEEMMPMFESCNPEKAIEIADIRQKLWPREEGK